MEGNGLFVQKLLSDVLNAKLVPTPKPLILTDSDIIRVNTLVRRYLPPELDREFVADSIILEAWLKDVPHISNTHIKYRCISAWRKHQSEVKHNEGALRAGLTRSTSTAMIMKPDTVQPTPQQGKFDDESSSDQATIERKILVEQAVGKLTPFERRLIWMRYYDDQTLEEIVSRVPLKREQVQQALKVALYKMRVHLS